jgi:hypothetical protein
VHWSQLTQDGVASRAVVNTVMNLRVPSKARVYFGRTT